MHKNPDKLRRAQSLVGTSDGRPEGDFYVTPPYATEALLQVENFVGKIWEPACGDGAICKVLEQHGHTVVGSDLYDRGYGIVGHDFLKSDWVADNIITNPPYKLGEQFIRHALRQSNNKVAMLMKLNFLEGVKRKTLFTTEPLKTVHVFSKRLSMYRNGEKGDYAAGMIAFAWYIFEHDYVGKPTLNWI